ncbi:MAG: hypothetical protein JOY80_10745, partial [Candidatus Dormibacteraeota bacterium]|nr:hypothetical protein [Candidatus Dormibacteraeota bacterium]
MNLVPRLRRPSSSRVSAILAALVVALVGISVGVTRGYGAWTPSTQNGSNTTSTIQLITPTVLTSTHATGLFASGASQSVTLTWDEQSTWVQGYDILRSTSTSGPFTQVGSVSGAATTAYTDTSAVYNSQYYYEVAPYYDMWNPTSSAQDMALSLAPSTGKDATPATPVTLTSTNLTALSSTSGAGYTTAANWSTQSVFSGSVQAVAFISNSTGWVVGAGGLAYKSTDGGQSWTAETSGATNQLNGVVFTDSNNGWAVGGTNGTTTIVHTSTGGTVWSGQTPPTGVVVPLSAISMSDVNNGWAVGSTGTVIHTSNGGTGWATQTSAVTLAATNLLGVSAPDSTHAWAVGASGGIETTSNGGSTWTAQTSGVTQQLNAVSFTDDNNGWAVGNSGTIVHTSNGGTTWSTQTSGTTQNLFGVHFIDALHGWVDGAS